MARIGPDEKSQLNRQKQDQFRFAAIRNVVTGAFRRAGYAGIARARRYYGRDEQRILAL